MKITSNKILAAIALLLALFSLLAGNPFSEKPSLINPEQLADSLISKKQNLLIIDLREKKDFDDYHIPSAINIDPVQINTNIFGKKKMIVFYSGRDNISKTIHYKFKKAGFNNIYFFNGGIDDWMNRVIFPVLPEVSTKEEENELRKIESRSMFFGGQPERKGGSIKVYRREGC